MASLLKKKAQSYNTPEVLQEIQTKAMSTLNVLTRNMITGDVPIRKIFEFYNECKRENVIRLLLRCKKMYEARINVKRILLLFI
jgi:hypothetical protein